MKTRNGKLRIILLTLLIFFFGGLNVCVFLYPEPVSAAEPEKMQMAENHGHFCKNIELNIPGPELTPGHLDAENKEADTLLPCCENHDKGAKTDMPREEKFCGQFACLSGLEISLSEPEIKTTSGILTIDLPPPEAGLIKATIKRE